MKLRRKRVIFRAMAVLVIVLGIIVLAFLEPGDSRESQARRLMAELRDAGRFREWLIKLKLAQPSARRGGHVIARELAALGQSAVPVCVKALRDDDKRVRYWVADALRKMDPVPREAAPALIQSLNDKDTDVRRFAADALGNIPSEADKIIPALVRALGHEHPGLREAAGALAKLRLIGEAMPVWIDALENGNDFARLNAAVGLGGIGPAAKGSVPGLTRALECRDPVLRFAAAHALGEIGPAAKAAVPALEKALKDGDKEVRKAAAKALKKIQPVGSR